MIVDPFAGEIRDGRMYGRGACDMKGGLAAVLCALKALVRAGVKPKGGITFYSDIEEEYGGPAGMEAMMSAGNLDVSRASFPANPPNWKSRSGTAAAWPPATKPRPVGAFRPGPPGSQRHHQHVPVHPGIPHPALPPGGKSLVREMPR